MLMCAFIHSLVAQQPILSLALALRGEGDRK